MNRLVLGILGFSLISSSVVLAQNAPAPTPNAEAPGSHQGRHGKGHGERFEKADSNKDGKLSFEEFKAAREDQMKQMFQKMDANGDGSLTKEEIRDGMKNRREERRARREEWKAKRQQLQSQQAAPAGQ